MWIRTWMPGQQPVRPGSRRPNPVADGGKVVGPANSRREFEARRPCDLTHRECKGRERAGEQQTKVRFELGLPNLSRVSPTVAGDLRVTGTVEGPRQSLSADTRLTTNLSVRGSPRGTVAAQVQARGLPQAPQGIVRADGQFDGAPLQVNVELQPAHHGDYHVTIRHADWKSAHANGDVTLGKSVADARGSARIALGDLSDFNWLAGSQLSGSVNGQLGLTSRSGRPNAQLNVDAHDVVAGGVTANAQVRANGPMDALEVSVSGDSPAVAGQPARIRTAAVVNLTQKHLELSSLEASYHGQDLHLLAPAKVQFAQGLKVQQLRLGIQDATVEVDGELSPALDVRARSRSDPVDQTNLVPTLLQRRIRGRRPYMERHPGQKVPYTCKRSMSEPKTLRPRACRLRTSVPAPTLTAILPISTRTSRRVTRNSSTGRAPGSQRHGRPETRGKDPPRTRQSHFGGQRPTGDG